MSEEKKLRFGNGYKDNRNIPPLENWKKKKEFYLKKGLDIGDYPVMTEAEEKEVSKELAFLV